MRSRRSTRSQKTDATPTQNGASNDAPTPSSVPLRNRKNAEQKAGASSKERINGADRSKSPSKTKQTQSQSTEPNQAPDAISESKKTRKHQREPSNYRKTCLATQPCQSYAVLLTQGIISGDEEKIGSVIKSSTGNLLSVMHTVRDLPAVHVVPFLTFIEKQLRHGDLKNTREWIIWTRALLNTHTSYLSSVTDLDRKLGPMAEWMQKRVRNMDKLLSLQGKLGMIAEQMNRRAHPVLYAQQKPLVVFQPDEGDSDIEEAEYELEETSNDEWWQDQADAESDQEMGEDSDSESEADGDEETDGEGNTEDDEEEDDGQSEHEPSPAPRSKTLKKQKKQATMNGGYDEEMEVDDEEPRNLPKSKAARQRKRPLENGH
ncbi:Protein T10B5.3 [Aphelenchoides avenae]|nr:Protein T10B5.3 [Aphelenchus avenae]